MKSLITAAILCSALTACISLPSTQPETARPVFPVEEYAKLDERTGAGVVTGQVFLRTRGGEVRYGAGSEVWLNPVTSYSLFWYENAYVAQRRLAPSDPQQDKYIISTQADGGGNFRFENVPAGEYYLTSSVFWEVPGPYYSQRQGGLIVSRIKVEDGRETRQILTR